MRLTALDESGDFGDMTTGARDAARVMQKAVTVMQNVSAATVYD